MVSCALAWVDTGTTTDTLHDHIETASQAMVAWEPWPYMDTGIHDTIIMIMMNSGDQHDFNFSNSFLFAACDWLETWVPPSSQD